MPEETPSFLKDEPQDYGRTVPEGRPEGPIDTPVSYIQDAAGAVTEFGKSVIDYFSDKETEVQQEPERTFPAPPLETTGKLVEDAPIFMHPDVYAGKDRVQTQAPGWMKGFGDELEDSGMTSWTIDMISNAMIEDDADDAYHVMSAGIPQLIQKYHLPDVLGDELMKAGSLEEAEAQAAAAARQLRRMNGREQMGMFQTGVTGLVGFVADPATLALTYGLSRVGPFGGAAGYAVVTARLSARAAMAKKLATWSAFAATEEAIRNAPRLSEDITYGYDRYLTDIQFGALFGAGMVGALPVGKFALSKSYRAMDKAINNSVRALRENTLARTSANVLVAATKVSPKAAADKAIQSALKQMDVGAAIRTARNKARKQIKESKTARKIDEVHESVVSSLKAATEIEGADVIQAFATGIRNLIDDVVPTDSKIRAAVEKFNEKIDKYGAPAEHKPAGAAARKSTLTTHAEDVTQDVADIAKYREKSIKASMDEIDKLEKEGLETLAGIKGPQVEKVRLALQAAAREARKAVETRAVREGLKVKRKAISKEKAHASSVKSLNAAIDKLGTKELAKILHSLNITSTSDVMPKILGRLGIVGVKGTDPAEAIAKYINANPKKAKTRATHVRDVITHEYHKARQSLEDAYTGNPADKNFLRAKEILKTSQDRMEATADWIGMLNSERYADLAAIDPRWALLSREYEEGMGAANRAILQEQYQQLAQRFISNQFGTLTESLSSRLVRTQVPLAEWVALNILELPAGTGGKIARNDTAAVLSQMMEAELQVPLNKAWFKLMDDEALDMGYGRLKRMFLRTQGANTSDLVKDVARKVMIEMNNRQMGKTSKMPSRIKRFCDELERTNQKAYDLQLEHNIDGITGHNRMNAYMKQAWNDGAIMDYIENPNIGKDGIVELLSKSLRMRAGDALTKQQTDDLAEAVINTKITAMHKPQVDSFRLRSENLPNTMASLEDILENMRANNKLSSLEAVMKWTKSVDTGGPGYVNKRFLNLDYEAQISKNGELVSIMDLLDNDVIANANRYNKEAAGRAAISQASGGKLRSDQDIADLIGAIGMQASEMGTYVNTKDLRNVFKQMLGLPFDGVLPMDLRKIRDAVSLAGMNGLGESQLAEAGLAINRGLAGLLATHQLASKTAGKLKQWRGLELTEKQKTDTKFLNELQEFSRLYEDMHHLARNNVHFDMQQSQAATSVFNKVVDTATGGKYRPTLQYMQTRWTGYSAIRTAEEQIAMAGLIQDAIKAVRTGKSFTTANRFSDVGLDLDLIKRKLDDGSIKLKDDGTVETLGMERWSPADNYKLGVALRRHSGQQVQIGFAGEMSPLMMNPQVAMLMQFKTYPMLAAEKQMGRNAMFGDREAAMGIALNATSSAAARWIRYQSLALALPEEKRERYIDRKLERDFAHDTLAYMGIVGMMVNAHDMVRDVGYGDSSVADQIPVTNWANNYLDAVKATGNIGDMDERDVANMQRGAPLGTIAQVNIIAGIMRTMMETDHDDFIQQPRNRGN